MKKKMLIASLLVAGLVVTTPVNAMTEAQLREKLVSTYTINGKKASVNKKTVEKIDKYLKEFDVSSDDCDYIAKQIDAAIKEVEKTNATSWAELTSDQVTALTEIANNVSKNTEVKVSLSKGGSLTILDKDGNVWDTIDDVTNPAATNTNDSMSIVLGASAAISLVGLLLVTKKVVKANA